MVLQDINQSKGQARWEDSSTPARSTLFQDVRLHSSSARVLVLTQSQKEPHLNVSWITAGGEERQVGRRRPGSLRIPRDSVFTRVALCDRAWLFLPRVIHAGPHAPFLIFPPKAGGQL